MVTTKWSGLNQDATARHSPLLNSVIAGKEHTQSFPNSQYTAGGVSSCGLAALNCVRIAFRNSAGGSVALLQSLLGSPAAETTDEILTISNMWSGSAHLEVDDLLQLPLFARSFVHLDTQYAKVNINQLLALLRQLEGCAGLAAAIITRPPEIIACLKVPLHDMNPESSRAVTPSNVFVIFDSHPRPSHPDGVGWFFNTSLDATANHLHTLIGVDRRIFDDPDLQWQAQLLNQFSGHIVTPQEHQKPSGYEDADMQHLIWDSSSRILKLQVELAETKYHSEMLESINKKYEEEHDELRSSKRAAQKRIKELEDMNRNLSKRLESTNNHGSHRKVSGTSMKSYAAALNRQQPPPTSSHLNDYSAGQSHHPRAARPSGSLQNTANNIRDVKGKGKEHVPHSFSSTSVDPDYSPRELQEQHDHMTAIQQQRRYEDEARHLEQERLSLAASAQVTFTCGVCMELVLDEDLAFIDKCQHQFCRECLQGYVLSKIQDRRFPIVCPTCMSDKAHPNPGIVEPNLVEQLYIPPKDYEIFEEMMLSQHCIPVHCSRCSRTAFVDRNEYQVHDIVACPLPGCTHAWCKSCMQGIESGGPQHSCDGSNELASLMREKGWKACPGCKTNIQKSDGCNHMTCPSPGCNMHFCYRCGQGIIQSALRREVQTAISGHYRVCQLIEDVPDRGVPP